MPIVYDESLHPRGPDGQYIPKAVLQSLGQRNYEGDKNLHLDYRKTEAALKTPEERQRLQDSVRHYSQQAQEQYVQKRNAEYESSQKKWASDAAKQLQEQPPEEPKARVRDVLSGVSNYGEQFTQHLAPSTKDAFTKDLAAMSMTDLSDTAKGFFAQKSEWHQQAYAAYKARSRALQIDSEHTYSKLGTSPEERLDNAMGGFPFGIGFSNEERAAFNHDMAELPKEKLFKVASQYRDNNRPSGRLGNAVQEEAEKRGWHRDADKEVAHDASEAYFDKESSEGRIKDLLGVLSEGENDPAQHLDEDTKDAISQDFASMPSKELWDQLKDSYLSEHPTLAKIINEAAKRKKPAPDRLIKTPSFNNMVAVSPEYFEQNGLGNLGRIVPQFNVLMNGGLMLMHQKDAPDNDSDHIMDLSTGNLDHQATVFSGIASEPYVSAGDAPMSARNYGSTSQGAKIEDDWNPNAKHVYKKLNNDWYMQRVSGADADANETPYRLIPASKAPPMTRLPSAYWQDFDPMTYGAQDELVEAAEAKHDKHSSRGKKLQAAIDAHKESYAKSRSERKHLNARHAHSEDVIASDDRMAQRLKDVAGLAGRFPQSPAVSMALRNLDGITHGHNPQKWDDEAWGENGDETISDSVEGENAAEYRDHLKSNAKTHATYNADYGAFVDGHSAKSRETSQTFRAKATEAVQAARHAVGREIAGGDSTNMTEIHTQLDRLHNALTRRKGRE